MATTSYPYRYIKLYCGPLKAAVLDFSGTTVDKYVLAPCVAFVEVFKSKKVPITMQEAREPMGLRKDLHIKAITEMSDVRERWNKVHGRYPDQNDVDEMYKSFEPHEIKILPQYAGLIDGCKEAVDTLRRDYGMKIGVTTGFSRKMIDVLLAETKKEGFEPDAAIAGDDVANGVRPKPFMLYRNLELMDISPIQAVVKVDDTVSGIGEGLEAGCWTVGVARWSNYMDVDSFEHADKLTDEDIQIRMAKCKEKLWKAGAHYVVDSIADLPAVCGEINKRLANGEKP